MSAEWRGGIYSEDFLISEWVKQKEFIDKAWE
jgi:hypothetical protein